MDQATIVRLLNAIVYVAFFMLAGTCAWLAKVVFKSRDDKDSQLATSLADLATAVAGLTREVHDNALMQVGHEKEIAEHRRELDGIFKGAACLNQNCPLRPAQVKP